MNETDRIKDKEAVDSPDTEKDVRPHKEPGAEAGTDDGAKTDAGENEKTEQNDDDVIHIRTKVLDEEGMVFVTRKSARKSNDFEVFLPDRPKKDEKEKDEKPRKIHRLGGRRADYTRLIDDSIDIELMDVEMSDGADDAED